MRLRSRLLLLILATMLPLIAYSATTQYMRFRDWQEEMARERAGRMAAVIRQAIDARLIALRVLALSPTLQAGDLSGFRHSAEGLINAELPGANLVLLRGDGQQILNTAVPPGEPLPVSAAAESVRAVFRTGEPLLTDLFLGTVLRRLVVAIKVPVKDAAGRVIYDLTLNPTPNAFLDPIRDEEPLGAVTTVYDSRGAVVARSRDHDQHIGQPAPGPLLDAILRPGGAPPTLFEVESPQDGRSLVALRRIHPYGWAVAVELPAAALSRAALRSVQPTLIVAAVMVLLSILLATVAARQVAAPIMALRDMAARPGAGDWRGVLRLPEARGVAAALEETRQRVRSHTAELEKALRERDLLLREVYHRVKNNLQTVDALLSMQRRRINDPAVIDTLEELRDRIHTLAVVHAQLMLSPDLQRFDVCPFMVELTDNLSTSLGSRDRPVSISLECEPFPVSLDLAIPLGLLVTELVTNGAKHAYKGHGGPILVSLRREAGNMASVTVQDQGEDPSAPRRFQAEGGIGARLVRGLVKQLSAELSVDHRDGMRVRIRLPLPEERA